MIHYTLSHIQRFLRETLAPPAPPQVMLGRTRYLVHLDHVIHQVRRDGVCSCGATFKSPCPAILAVRDFLAAGGSRPLGHHPDTWPESWTEIPPLCPVCDCPTLPDPYLDSRAGPGWQCSLAGAWHHWQVRVERLRRLQRRYPPKSVYPWYDTPIEEQVWTSHNQNEIEGEYDHALHGPPPGEGRDRARIAGPWLDPVRLLGGQVRCDDRLLCARQLAGDC